ncbi:MAG: DUF6531 domain-containing protein, partial [Oscillospiraceae bacterium]|nr:DUF6531 domain-containing protein [Oscillospiraceae bacterium]
MAMQTSIEAVGEMNPQLAKDLASGMGELAEEMEKVLNGDKEAEEHLLNTLFGGDKKASKSLTEDQKKAIDQLLAGMNMDCVFGYEPINFNSGNFYMDQEDVSMDELGGKFKIQRCYNSKTASYNSIFGRGWEFKYTERVRDLEDGTIAYFKGDGSSVIFKLSPKGVYRCPNEKHLDIKKLEDGDLAWEIEDKDKIKRIFDKNGNQREIRDNKGYSTKFNYNEENKLKEIITPSGKIFSIKMDESGNICSIKLPNEKSLYYDYNANGDLITYTDALGEKTTYNYDDNHLMLSWIDPNGTIICKNVYDKEGRVISQKDGNGSEVKLEYKDKEKYTKVTDPEGFVTKYYSDESFRNVKTEYPDGTKEESFFGVSGHLRYKWDREKNKYEWSHDLSGNLTKEIRIDGKTKFFEYNEMNLPVKITDFDGSVTTL